MSLSILTFWFSFQSSECKHVFLGKRFDGYLVTPELDAS